jgi:hypothetical protein
VGCILNIITIFLTIIYGIIIFTLSFIIIKSILIQIIDNTLGFDKLFINKTKSNITKILINIITFCIAVGIYILCIKLNL